MEFELHRARTCLITDRCVLSLSTDSCCQVITLGLQCDRLPLFDLREVASRGPSALADILVFITLGNRNASDSHFCVSVNVYRIRIAGSEWNVSHSAEIIRSVKDGSRVHMFLHLSVS